MTSNSPASPEGSILTPDGWATGKVEFAGPRDRRRRGRNAAGGRQT